ncbi:MAG: HAD-IA family hydrolase [Gammaproteobacteria bacterium]|nr:HAD-IA family hydrolase [Gammaproteobacteria bacterium]
MTTRLIVFDWDGTLMDSEARIVACMQAAIDDLGLPDRTAAEISNIIGLGLRESVTTLFPELKESMYHKLVDQYRYHFLVGDKTPSPLFPGVTAMLDDLVQQDCFLAIATGKGRAGLDKVLDETGLATVFHSTRCADETFSKPHPQMLLELMDELGVETTATLMVGDTEYDLQMAHNSKAHALAVSYGVHDKSRLLECRPLACVDSIDELHHWLLAGQWGETVLPE